MRGPDAFRTPANRCSPGLRRRAALLISSLALLPGIVGLTGCNTTSKGNSALTNDPLVGGGPPLPTARSANQGPTGAVAVPATPLAGTAGPGGTAVMPALQAPTGTPSNAALAANSAQPINPASMLRIGQPQPVQPTSTAPTGGWTGTPPAGTTQPNQGAMLRPPATPAANTMVPATPIATSQQPPATAATSTDQQLLDQLQTRGILWQKLEYADGMWKFTCAIPNKQIPNAARSYVGTDKDRVNAIKQVVDQMDRERN